MILTDKNYFSLDADREYMSTSQFGAWMKCAAAEYDRQNGGHEDEDQAWGIGGNYCHTARLQPELLDQYKHDHRHELLTLKYPTHSELKALAEQHNVDLKGALSVKAKTEQRLIERGVTIPAPTESFKHDYQWIPRTLAAFDRQKVFTDALSYGLKERIITFELGGVQWKARIDNDRGLDGFDDLKFMRDFNDGWSTDYNARVPWYSVYRYERQMAIYQHGLGTTGTPNIFAASKQSVPDVAWVRFDDQRMLDQQLNEVERAIPLVMMWKNGTVPAERCEDCDYCRSTKIIEHPLSAVNSKETL